MDKLIAIVTGPAHNGTTYLRSLIDSYPEIHSAFETGILLNNDFSLCKPFCDWMYEGGEHWGIPREVDLFDSKLSFDDKYQLIFKYKGSVDNGIHQTLIKNSKYIVDKTPAYFYELPFVLSNLPVSIPVLITIKYLKDSYYSYVVKRNIPIDAFNAYMEVNLNTLRWLEENKPSNVYLFVYDDIVDDVTFPDKLKKIISHRININGKLSRSNYVDKIVDKEKEVHYACSDWNPPTSEQLNFCLPEEILKYEELYNNLITNLKCQIKY